MKLPVRLYPYHLTAFRPTFIEVVRVLLVQVINRSHAIVDDEAILKTIDLKLLQSLIERESVENALIDEVLFEMDRLAVLDIGVLLDDVDEVDDHLRLRPVEMRALMDTGNIVG